MLAVIVNTMIDALNISALLLILLFCYLLIGMELYANKLGPVNEKELLLHNHQENFNTFFEGFISVFIVLANNGWTRIYINHSRQTDSLIASSIFFFSLLVLSQFILLNLFISVLINNFEELSVKNDLINKISDLKKDSAITRLKKWIIRYIACKKTSEE